MKHALVAVALILSLSPIVRADELPPPIQFVANVLELSEAQTHALIESIQARELAIHPLAEQLHMRHEALGRLVESPDADAATAGRLLLEIRAIEREVARVTREAAAQFEQTLDPDQVEKLEHIRQAAQVCPAVPAFQAAGLL